MLRVLLLSPYSPLDSHDHAAADYMPPLVLELGRLVDLHVYAPTAQLGVEPVVIDGVTHYPGSPQRRSPLAVLGRYPYHWRENWSGQATRDALHLIEVIQPDLVHIEYPQPIEVAFGVKGIPVTFTAHDLVARAYQQSIRSRPLTLRGGVERLELARYRHWESAMLRRGAHVFTLSPKDAEDIAGLARSTSSPPIGIELNVPQWSDTPHDRPVLLFAGAMWRTANALVAESLARDVLPRVRDACPGSVFRIVGARPTPQVLALADLPGIEVVGAVDDYSAEFARAAVVLAPSIVEVGVLLKALHALAAGAPTILNTLSARGLPGAVSGEHFLTGDTATDLAASAIRLLTEPATGRRLGAAGRRYVELTHSWAAYASEYANAFHSAVRS